MDKCLYNTFQVAGDINSKNNRLEDDLLRMSETKDHSMSLYRNPSLFIDDKLYHEPFYPDRFFSEEQMIADVCAALLQNLRVESPYCLHFLSTDYAELENYDVEHRREIGKYLKPKKGSVRSRPLGLISLGLGLGALLVCNCLAWTIIKYQQKRRQTQ